MSKNLETQSTEINTEPKIVKKHKKKRKTQKIRQHKKPKKTK